MSERHAEINYDFLKKFNLSWADRLNSPLPDNPFRVPNTGKWIFDIGLHEDPFVIFLQELAPARISAYSAFLDIAQREINEKLPAKQFYAAIQKRDNSLNRLAKDLTPAWDAYKKAILPIQKRGAREVLASVLMAHNEGFGSLKEIEFTIKSYLECIVGVQAGLGETLKVPSEVPVQYFAEASKLYPQIFRGLKAAALDLDRLLKKNALNSDGMQSPTKQDVAHLLGMINGADQAVEIYLGKVSLGSKALIEWAQDHHAKISAADFSEKHPNTAAALIVTKTSLNVVAGALAVGAAALSLGAGAKLIPIALGLVNSAYAKIEEKIKTRTMGNSTVKDVAKSVHRHVEGGSKPVAKIGGVTAKTGQASLAAKVVTHTPGVPAHVAHTVGAALTPLGPLVGAVGSSVGMHGLSKRVNESVTPASKAAEAAVLKAYARFGLTVDPQYTLHVFKCTGFSENHFHGTMNGEPGYLDEDGYFYDAAGRGMAYVLLSKALERFYLESDLYNIYGVQDMDWGQIEPKEISQGLAVFTCKVILVDGQKCDAELRLFQQDNAIQLVPLKPPNTVAELDPDKTLRNLGIIFEVETGMGYMWRVVDSLPSEAVDVLGPNFDLAEARACIERVNEEIRHVAERYVSIFSSHE
ncbi:hypothetical protein [Streptomyces vinaceus]|uniref:hypothetical protein n=1 Tax=Streptomyces vinaceus TaxID=1960 RepID=UPI0037F4D1D8